MRTTEMQIAVALGALVAESGSHPIQGRIAPDFLLDRDPWPALGPSYRQKGSSSKVGKKRYTERRAKAKAAKQARKRNRSAR